MHSRRFYVARAPIALVTTLSFIASLLPARHARAEDEGPSANRSVTRSPVVEEISAETPVEPRVGTPNAASPTLEHERLAVSATRPGAVPVAMMAMAASEGSTEISAQATSLPQGAGKAEGMGESFSAQLSTGIAAYALPLAVPSSRGVAQPSLTLTYGSSAGAGVAGMGWNIGVPFIARQTDHGHPLYRDPPEGGPWTIDQDRFVYNGAELVPLCVVLEGGCAAALPGEAMPAWATGWQYFRPRIEGSFQRFFWSPDHRTWRIQDKSGLSIELGVPLDGTGDTNALETAPEDASKIFRWNVTRQYDVHGDGSPAGDAQPKPYNAVRYRYATDAGIAYPSDIYETPPVVGAVQAALSQYAHHVHLAWDVRPDALTTFRRGWQAQQRLRLARVDVTSKPFVAALASARRAVRRYHLTYDATSHVSLLASVQLEGRCGDEAFAAAEGDDGALPATSCPRMPPTRFEYTHVRRADGSRAPSDLPGYEGFDDTVRTLSGSPPSSIDSGFTNFYDVNADGLADVLVTNAAAFGGAHGVFLNGLSGAKDTFGAAIRMTVPDGGALDAFALTFKNANVVPLDFDGNGVLDLVYMPPFKAPTVYTPSVAGGTATWIRRVPDVPPSLNPKIDLTGHNPQVKVADVDGDGFVDILATSGDRTQTYFSLSRYEGGDGKFGSVVRDGVTLTLSADPVSTCLPVSGAYSRMGDADVHLADMNGDGLVDLVRVRPGDVRYWPGRGDGHFGTGLLSSCTPGALVDGAYVTMSASPVPPASGAGIALGDVNGDGLSDVVQIRAAGANVWLNIDGAAFTDRHTTAPSAVASSPTRVRLTDVNGSGTPDLVWGDSSSYRYVDLLGGSRPWLLSRVTSTLGKTTDLEYAASTDEMLAAQRAGQPWSTTAPMVLHVVKRVTVRDNLEKVGRPGGVYVTDYAYRDPVYDGAQREFRGFRTASETHAGDQSNPSSTVTTSFLLGECAEDGVPGRCGLDARFQDNPREALKGLPRTADTFDTSGAALETLHTTYRLRPLYAGLDGRSVSVALSVRADTFRYDTATFDGTISTTSLVDVEVEAASGSVTPDPAVAIALRGTTGRVHLASTTSIDRFGNATDSSALGCIEGCPAPDEAITSHITRERRADDASGWLWRATESYVVGSARPLELRHHMWTEYDALGRPVRARAELRGTLPLDRFHAVPAAPVAPPPAAASRDGVIALGTTEYDSVGNAVRSVAAEGCTSAEYDPAYGDFVIVGTTYAGERDEGGCGTRLLVTTAEYDRGFALARASSGYNGERARVDLDGFGRVVRTFAPHPARVGDTTAVPASTYEYVLPSDPELAPYEAVHMRVQSGAAVDEPAYRDSWTYSDALGRTLASITQADVTAGDGGDWVVSGVTSYDARGRAARRYHAAFWTGDPAAFPLGAPATTTFARQTFDAFGRPIDAFAEDGTQRMHMVHHALAEDTWDAADLAPGSHHGTFSTITADGHGRTVSQVERFHDGARLDIRDQRSAYLPTGEAYLLARMHVGTSDPPVVRWMRYDSLGRLVQNVDPDTTKGFSPEPSADADSLKAWRQAYDDAGNLVGTSDARGCGENFHRDAIGRVVAEDFSPCTADQPAYSAPDLRTGDGTEAFYRYDQVDSNANAIASAGCTVLADAVRGRAVSIASRGSLSVASFDGRGRVVCAARQVARPGVPAASLSARFAPRWYVQNVAYDGADRVVSQSTGARSSDLVAADGESRVSFSYARNGGALRVDSSYGPLVTAMVHDADGAPVSITYGDVARTATAYGYDARHRLRAVQTVRARPDLWSGVHGPYSPPASDASSTFQLVLEDGQIDYDDADNPVALRDFRIPDEWPAGAKPVSRSITYDDLYRVSSVQYDYAGATDAWLSPFDAEDHDVAVQSARARPSPHVAFDRRVGLESFRYDWLGNTVESQDDAHGFYDRSLGTITNGTATRGPYQMREASNRSGSPSRSGDLDATYDDAGNLTAMTVRRDGLCAPAGSPCWQRFQYAWDETGRLLTAYRWDLAPGERFATGDLAMPPPSRGPDVDLRYAYGASDDRVLKTSTDAAGRAVHTAYVFSSLDVRRASWIEEAGDYELDGRTEVAYLEAGGRRLARVVSADVDAPSATSGRQHVFLELPDHLGSTSIVVDKDTSELVERSTYATYGATESDYRPERWKSFREDYRFTGKEDDIEVGLQYFGKRYFSPQLGRWMSADPMAIHGLAADANVYAYVHGRSFASVDPNGTCELVCMMLIAALVSAAVSAGTQWYQTGSFDAINWGAVGIAAFAGAVGGAAGIAAAPAGAALGTALGVGEGLGSAAIGGAIGSAAGGAAGRSATTALVEGGDAAAVVSSGLNPVEVGKDLAIGAAGGVAVYGAGQGLKAAYNAIKGAGPAAEGGAAAGGTKGSAPGGGGPGGAAAEPKPIQTEANGAMEEPAAPKAEPEERLKGCFVGGTKVLTVQGEKAIEDIRTGDHVWSENPDTGEVTVHAVLHRWVHEVDRIVSLTIATTAGDAHTIGVTLEHPFWLDGRGWTKARELLPNDELHSELGVRVRVVATSSRPQVTRVYNLEVEEDHDYFVSPLHVLVHNIDDCVKRPKIVRAPKSIAKPEVTVTHVADDPYKAYAAARAAAIDKAGLGGMRTVAAVSEMGPFEGYHVGQMSPDGTRGWRIDYDPGKEFHVNWWDSTTGRIGAEVVKGGDEQLFWEVLSHFGGRLYGRPPGR